MASDRQSARRKDRRFFTRMSCLLLGETASGGLALWLALKTGSLFLGFLAYLLWAFGVLAAVIMALGIILHLRNRRTIRRMMRGDGYDNNIYNHLTNNQNNKKQ